MNNKKMSLRHSSFLCMIFSCIIFAILYQAAALYSSNLEEVSSFYFEWEKNIYFIPWMIIPYETSALFFIAVFFMFKDKKRLYLLTKRINFITIVSVISFFMFPLKFAFIKPKIESTFLSSLFKFIEVADTNFNQCPSLHISYAIIFGIVFYKEMKSDAKYIFIAWFLLMGISTITTYQHHIIDIIFSFLLVIITIFIFPDKEKKYEK